MIENKDISVVFQGPLFFDKEISLTNKCLETVRTVLPGAEIVLSTWKGEKIESIDPENVDILLLNEDPGTFSPRPDLAGSNNVRQIVSTRNGIAATTRKFVLKMRADNFLFHDGFKKHFGVYQKRCSEFRILEERVLTLAFGTVNPRRCVGCYWFCDWVQFGLRSDVKNIWDVPLPTKRAIDEQDETLEGRSYAAHLQLNEIYIWSSFLRKNVSFRYQHIKECSDYAICNTELSFANNLVLLELAQFGVESVKNFNRQEIWKKQNVLFWAMCYSHMEWLELYKKYCDSSADIPVDHELLLKKSAIEDYFLFIRKYGLPGSPGYIEDLRKLGVSNEMLPFDTGLMGEYVRIVNQYRMQDLQR